MCSTLYLIPLRSEHKCRDGPKHLFDVDVLLGGGLEELNAHLLGKPPGVFGENDLPVWVIALVAHKDPGNARGVKVYQQHPNLCFNIHYVPVYDVAVLVDFMEPP